MVKSTVQISKGGQTQPATRQLLASLQQRLEEVVDQLANAVTVSQEAALLHAATIKDQDKAAGLYADTLEEVVRLMKLEQTLTQKVSEVTEQVTTQQSQNLFLHHAHIAHAQLQPNAPQEGGRTSGRRFE